jgi:hypothetical protein
MTTESEVSAQVATVAESFSLEVLTLAQPGVEDFMASVAAVLDRFPQHAPTRVGPRDPARTKVVDLGSQMVDLGHRLAAERLVTLHLACPERDEFGTVSYVTDPFRFHPPGHVHASCVDLGLAPEDTSTVGELLGELAEATEAFYGFAVCTHHARQLRGRFLTERIGRYGRSPAGGQPPTWQPPPFQALEMQVPDVFWVQVFGPAYVEMWGEDKLLRAGVRRRKLSHGGYVVWATEEPPAYDDDVDRPEGYAWKNSVYDAIGPEPFMRSDRRWNEFGQHVPLMTAHADALIIINIP